MVPAKQKGKSSLQADFPFPPRSLGPVYFEITILSTEHIVETGLDPIVTLGFCGEFCDLTDSHTGCARWSVGYHGGDRFIFEGARYSRHMLQYKFGPGGTVGCGINYDEQKYFFTLGEKVVGTFGPNRFNQSNKERTARFTTHTGRYTSTRTIHRKLYPAISYSGGACEVKVNFGQDDFVWPGARK